MTTAMTHQPEGMTPQLEQAHVEIAMLDRLDRLDELTVSWQEFDDLKHTYGEDPVELTQQLVNRLHAGFITEAAERTVENPELCDAARALSHTLFTVLLRTALPPTWLEKVDLREMVQLFKDCLSEVMEDPDNIYTFLTFLASPREVYKNYGTGKHAVRSDEFNERVRYIGSEEEYEPTSGDEPETGIMTRRSLILGGIAKAMARIHIETSPTLEGVPVELLLDETSLPALQEEPQFQLHLVSEDLPRELAKRMRKVVERIRKVTGTGEDETDFAVLTNYTGLELKLVQEVDEALVPEETSTTQMVIIKSSPPNLSPIRTAVPVKMPITKPAEITEPAVHDNETGVRTAQVKGPKNIAIGYPF